MSEEKLVLEYKCPSCGAPLIFGQDTHQMTCEYCNNEFSLEVAKAFNESQEAPNVEEVEWEENKQAEWTEDEQSGVRRFICQSCGGELMTDEITVATFCPYCDNPAILPSRLSGGIRPDAVIPFKTGKEDAKAAFLKMCKGKPLLPKLFMQQHRIEKITGIYVPFWLYNCNSDFNGSYKATRVRHWSDSNYHYTKTDHFMLSRACKAQFTNIPMDASSKFDDTIMEAIEPFDYSQIVDFDTAYLSGFFADKYDVESASGEDRIKERVGNSLDDMLAPTFVGYSSVLPTSKNLHVSHGKASYVLLPVWMLNTKYKDKTYVFAMNGQTGKMAGTFPICPKQSAAWFAGICAGVTLIAGLIQMFVL